MISEAGDPILSWQQTCSLVTTSSKSTFFNFLSNAPLRSSSQPQLRVSHLPHWPCHLGIFCKGHRARLWLLQHLLGACWASQWLRWVHCEPTIGCISGIMQNNPAQLFAGLGHLSAPEVSRSALQCAIELFKGMC